MSRIDAVVIKISIAPMIFIKLLLKKSDKTKRTIICGINKSKLKRLAYSMSSNGKERINIIGKKIVKVFL